MGLGLRLRVCMGVWFGEICGGYVDGLWTVCRWSGLIRSGGNWMSGGGALMNFGGRLNDFLGGFKLR